MTPPALSDHDGFDVNAWLCTVPGIPAWWPNAKPISADRLALADRRGGMPDMFNLHGEQL